MRLAPYFDKGYVVLAFDSFGSLGPLCGLRAGTMELVIRFGGKHLFHLESHGVAYFLYGKLNAPRFGTSEFHVLL